MNQNIDIKKYDKIVCSKDVKEKLSAISIKENNQFYFGTIPVFVSELLPENTFVMVEKQEFNFEPYCLEWTIIDKLNIALYDLIESCKHQLQELKEKMFNQLEGLLK